MRTPLFLAGLGAFGLVGVAQAEIEPGRFTVSQGLGTTGAETTVGYAVNEKVELRGTLSLARFGMDTNSDGVRYEGTFDGTTGGLFVDWRPFQNWLSVTAGAYVGDRGIDLNAVPLAPVSIGGVTYAPADVGRLEGRVDLGSLAPYVGLNADWRPQDNRGLGLRISAGVAFGEADVSLVAVGGRLVTDPALLIDLERESANLAEDVEMLKTYPVISAALTYRY